MSKSTETNLKVKQALTVTGEMGGSIESLAAFKGEVCCEAPNNRLDRFTGTLVWRDQKYPLDNQSVLLRGCTLRNTDWCFGMVLFAGPDTKLMQNCGKSSFKRTSIDRLMNVLVLFIFGFLVLMCIILAVGHGIWEHYQGSKVMGFVPRGENMGSAFSAFLTFWSYIIILNTVVPISLYVSMEVIRLGNSYYINWDRLMYYSRNDTPAEARTTTLNEELGQIRYVFSDKTGTLTQNIMTFNKCSINGKTYGPPQDHHRAGTILSTAVTLTWWRTLPTGLCPQDATHRMLAHRTLPTGRYPKDTAHRTLPTGCCPQDTAHRDAAHRTLPTGCCPQGWCPQDAAHRTQWVGVLTIEEQGNTVYRETDGLQSGPVHLQSVLYGDVIDHYSGQRLEITEDMIPVDFSFNSLADPKFQFYDTSLLEAVKLETVEVHNFFRLLALCHTVMPEEKNQDLVYQAQSPDEGALVTAARNFGFVFRSRTPESLTIVEMGVQRSYELLAILDFNNVRKRMSVIGMDVFPSSGLTYVSLEKLGLFFNAVITRVGLGVCVVRSPEGTLSLYCKGADTIIYQRLHESSSKLMEVTTEHLNEFAGEGLRTLVLAYKDLDEDYFSEWLQRHHEANTALEEREEKLNQLYEEIEKDLLLIGATAIEDKLQDGVSQTIEQLAKADIKIWVLTGDKQETAENIGYSCNLLREEMTDIFIVAAHSTEDVRQELRDARAKMRANSEEDAFFIPESILGNDPKVVQDEHVSGEFGLVINGHSLDAAHRRCPQDAAHRTLPIGRCPHGDAPHRDAAHRTLPTGLSPQDAAHRTLPTRTLHHRTLAPTGRCPQERSPTGTLPTDDAAYALESSMELEFLRTACMCKTVICCRVTPLQKAQVVELVKKYKRAVTLAIGDGANDVSMIKAAHIGVGISGQEGMQAVLSSDFSFAQFRFLQRLLLVHGRWSYLRMCKFLRYFFYKNFTFTFVHFWYAFFCGFSAQTVYDEGFIALYNLVYTSLPVLGMALFDQAPDRIKTTVLLHGRARNQDPSGSSRHLPLLVRPFSSRPHKGYGDPLRVPSKRFSFPTFADRALLRRSPTTGASLPRGAIIASWWVVVLSAGILKPVLTLRRPVSRSFANTA
ncbi:hypothetical protein NFI96_013691 [Prochilodus magdalenae]|nr:hypothetical protein NFI96_013691 [Prochilodus magdalenae]